MTDVIHEGTHAVDYVEGYEGDTFDSERRAYRNEHDFQRDKGMDLDFENHDEIDNHINDNY